MCGRFDAIAHVHVVTSRHRFIEPVICKESVIQYIIICIYIYISQYSTYDTLQRGIAICLVSTTPAKLESPLLHLLHFAPSTGLKSLCLYFNLVDLVEELK